MKKSLTFSFAMLLGVVVLLSPVSNALEADMSSSITYRPEDTQICYVSEIDEVISNTEIDKSVRQTVKERARTGATFYSITPESQEQIEQLFGVHFVENALLDTMEHSIAQKDQMNVFFNSSTKVMETEYTRYTKYAVQSNNIARMIPRRIFLFLNILYPPYNRLSK